MAVLVTGGAGFLGSHLTRYLIDKEHQVVVLDDLSGGYRVNVPQEAQLIEGSILDLNLVQNLFQTTKFDYVFHLAAYAAENLSHYIKQFNYTNNIIGSVNLINQSILHKVKCFVFTSSMAVYGRNTELLNEHTQPTPSDPYGIAKFAIELELQSTLQVFGLPYVIFRPHNIYGPQQNIWDRYRNVVGIFMNQAMRREPFTVFGDGIQKRRFSYIQDIVSAIGDSVEIKAARNQIFNIGADEEVSVIEMAQKVASVMSVDCKINFQPERCEAFAPNVCHKNVEKVFGQLPITPLDVGLKSMAEWALQQGPREPAFFEKIEIPQCLPGIWRDPND